MKVLHIITRLDPGGSSRICLTISGMLSRKGVDTYVASGGAGNSSGDIIRLRHLQRNMSFLKDLAAAKEIFHLCRKIKPDILHLHTSKAGFAGRIGGRLAGVKNIFYQPHGIVFYGYFSRIKSRVILIAEKLLAPLCRVIIVLTPKAREEFLGYGVGREKQYRVLENGVEEELFRGGEFYRYRLRERRGIKENETVFGMLGRLVPLKGHYYFIEAFAALCRKRPGLKGVIIGSGPLEDSLKARVKEKGLENRIIFEGYRPDVEKIIHMIDVIVQPSLVEGFGLSLIEAGAAGIPAIGFNVGGISDIVKDRRTGFLVARGDIPMLCGAMEYFLENPQQINRMGSKARERVLKKYTLDKMREKLYNIYGLNK